MTVTSGRMVTATADANIDINVEVVVIATSISGAHDKGKCCDQRNALELTRLHGGLEVEGGSDREEGPSRCVAFGTKRRAGREGGSKRIVVPGHLESATLACLVGSKDAGEKKVGPKQSQGGRDDQASRWGIEKRGGSRAKKEKGPTGAGLAKCQLVCLWVYRFLVSSLSAFKPPLSSNHRSEGTVGAHKIARQAQRDGVALTGREEEANKSSAALSKQSPPFLWIQSTRPLPNLAVSSLFCAGLDLHSREP